jgi:flagellar basal body-associated protein FliL
MDPQLEQRLAEQDKKLDQIYASIEKMRKYFLWTMIITIATIVLPLIALVAIIPWFLSVMSSAYTIQ